MATIKDVARHAGLSIATISKYLNGGNVLDENKTAIDKAVFELGYKVNHAARSLKTSRSMMVGVMIPSLSSPFFSRIIAIADAVLREAGYNILVCSYDFSPELEREKLRFLLGMGVDGIILVPERLSANDMEQYGELADRSVPLLLIDRLISGYSCDAVVVDNLNASYDAVERLIVAMHRKIGIIVGPPDISTARERAIGYRRVHEDYALPVEESLIKVGRYVMESGSRLFNELMDMETPPTAMFVTNYDMMLGAITAANERGIVIPDQLDFIGFDNIELTRLISQPISIVVQPMELIGQTAARLMLDRLSGNYESFPLLVRHKAKLLPPRHAGQPYHGSEE